MCAFRATGRHIHVGSLRALRRPLQLQFSRLLLYLQLHLAVYRLREHLLQSISTSLRLLSRFASFHRRYLALANGFSYSYYFPLSFRVALSR